MRRSGSAMAGLAAGSEPGRPEVQPGFVLAAEIHHRLPALKALTSLRFFAAVYVCVYHLGAGHSLLKWTVAENFLSSGDTGVLLFFILSGFILAYNYRKIGDLREFWVSRFARIYPVYLVALLLSFAYSLAPANSDTAHRALPLGLTLTLLQSWYPPYAESFNGPGWTLSVEAFFYALFPLVLRMVGQVKWRPFLLVCGAYVACSCVPAAISLIALRRGLGSSIAEFLVSSRLPVLHLPLFLIGAWLGREYASEQGHIRGAGRSSGLLSGWTLYPGVAGSVALLCAGPSGVYEPVRRCFLALCYAALIYGLAQVQRGVLTSRWPVLAGEISFSIYILQMPVFRTMLGIDRRLHMGACASIVTTLATLIVLSYFAYRFIELPARVSIRSRLTHRRILLEKI